MRTVKLYKTDWHDNKRNVPSSLLSTCTASGRLPHEFVYSLSLCTKWLWINVYHAGFVFLVCLHLPLSHRYCLCRETCYKTAIAEDASIAVFISEKSLFSVTAPPKCHRNTDMCNMNTWTRLTMITLTCVLNSELVENKNRNGSTPISVPQTIGQS